MQITLVDQNPRSVFAGVTKECAPAFEHSRTKEVLVQ